MRVAMVIPPPNISDIQMVGERSVKMRQNLPAKGIHQAEDGLEKFLMMLLPSVEHFGRKPSGALLTKA